MVYFALHSDHRLVFVSCFHKDGRYTWCCLFLDFSASRLVTNLVTVLLNGLVGVHGPDAGVGDDGGSLQVRVAVAGSSNHSGAHLTASNDSRVDSIDTKTPGADELGSGGGDQGEDDNLFKLRNKLYPIQSRVEKRVIQFSAELLTYQEFHFKRRKFGVLNNREQKSDCGAFPSPNLGYLYAKSFFWKTCWSWEVSSFGQCYKNHTHIIRFMSKGALRDIMRRWPRHDIRKHLEK